MSIKKRDLSNKLLIVLLLSLMFFYYSNQSFASEIITDEINIDANSSLELLKTSLESVNIDSIVNKTDQNFIDPFMLQGNVSDIFRNVEIDFSESDASQIKDLSEQEIQRNLMTVKPAVIRVVHLYEGKTTANSSFMNFLGFDGVAPQSEDFFGGLTGSGFIINSDGYFVTNGHV